MKIYKSFEQAKNGTLIPVFTNGKTMESRYNPERDAETLCNSIENNFDFFLVLGIGSGLFIKKLSERFPVARIIAFELYQEDIDFLRQSDILKELEKNNHIIFSSLDSLEEDLSQNYIPAKYGDLKIIEQRAWLNENAVFINQINSILQKTMGIISADFSVQSHFGKIWTTNILNNSLLAEKIYNKAKSNRSLSNIFSKDSLQKTAVIIAAGPTLDKTISILNDRNKYFIIATDTAGSSLIKHKIFPDVIVSIDGQNVSYNHFLNNNSTLYAFDLCSNFSAAKHIAETGNKLFFFYTGHPLANAINTSFGNIFPYLFSGAGTVTITATDLAVKAGFKKILVLGADFSYTNGKPYAAGTYLDSLYNQKSVKIDSAEKAFSKLMFRTELLNSDNTQTTPILEAYKTSFEKYLQQKNVRFSKKQNIYELLVSDNKKELLSFNCNKILSMKAFFNKLTSSNPEEAEILLLPYIAWLKNNKNYKNYSYSELLKLAFNTIVSYNI